MPPRTPQRPRSMTWLALAIFVVIALLALAGCALPAQTGPTTSILFAGGSHPAKTGIIVTVDIAFAPGVNSRGTTYPHEWVTVAPFTHLHLAERGTIIHMSIKVYPTEPGQTVTCQILFNGAAILNGSGSATYPKGAVCIGPPV